MPGVVDLRKYVRFEDLDGVLSGESDADGYVTQSELAAEITAITSDEILALFE